MAGNNPRRDAGKKSPSPSSTRPDRQRGDRPHKKERQLSSESEYDDDDDDDMYPPPQTSRPLSSQQLSLVRTLPGNDACVECSDASRPSWASVTYGVVLCLECAGIHRGLGVHLSFVRSLTMDDWTDEQYRRMIQGGNDKWKEFWEEHGGENRDVPGEFRQKVRLKYESNAARAYREALSLNAKACRTRADPNNPNALLSTPIKAVPTPTPNSTLEGESRLEEEFPPSFQDVLLRQAWPFVLSMLGSKKHYLFLWWVVGIASAYGAHWRGLPQGGGGNGGGGGGVTSSLPSLNPVAHGYMGASADNDNDDARGYHDLFALAILSFTVGLPYLLLRRSAFQVAQRLLANRQDAFKSARNLLMDRINSGRAQRLKRCDVYYPSVPKGGELRARYGLIFYPGALVDRTAYSPIASRLSELGILVAVANLEPYRVITKLKDYALREEVMRMLSDSVLLGNQGTWTVDDWAIGGHSLGGNVAIAAVANEFSSTMKKVVLWGVQTYPDSNTYPCDRTLRSIEDVDALVVNGSNDELCRRGAVAAAAFEASMPPKSRGPSVAHEGRVQEGRGHTYYLTIEGGNHAGCAHYGPQMFPLPDGTRTITLEQQQRRTAEATADFLLSRAKSD